MYIRAAKTEAEEAGISTEGMANSVSELREEILSLTGNRVDIMLDDDSFKSTYQIIEELSKIWGTLSETTRSNITELIGGGVKNANVVNALMSNMSTAAEVVEKTSNSAGSAIAENAKVLESIQGKLSVFKATFQELSQSFISSGFVKNVIDFGAELLRILLDVGVLIEKLGGLNNILMVTAGVIAIIKADALVSLLGKILAGIIGIIPALQSLVISLFELPMAMKIAKAEGQGLAAALDLVGISASTAQIAIAALVAILTVAIICISNYNRELEQTRRTNIDNANAAKKEADSLRDLIDQYKQLAEAEKWDATERDQVKSIQDQITKLVGVQADNLDLVNGKLDEEIKKLDAIALKTAEGNTGKLSVAKKSAEDSLIQSSYHGKWNSFAQTEQERATINVGAYAAASEIHAVRDVLNEIGLDEYWGSGNGIFQIDISSIDSILQSYNDMIKLQEYLVTNYEKEISTGGDLNDFYNELSTRVNQMTTAVNDYNSAISNYNENEAIKELGSYLKTNDIDSKDDFDNYINSIRNSTEYSEAYKDVLIKLVTDTFPQFTTTEDKAVASGKESLSDLAEAVSKLKSNYDLLATAQKEMADVDGGLSASTIKALADETDEYLGYLYEENGVIKLNINAWKEYANAKMLDDISIIKDEIEALQDKRNEIIQSSDALYEEVKAILAVGDAYNALTNGNVDYNKRPLVTPDKMQEFYPEFDGDIATTYSSSHTIGDGDALYTVEVTPILEDGTVLSPDALAEYINNLVTDSGIEGVLNSDTSNLVINIQPGDYDEEYWKNYQEQIGIVKAKHWELIQQLQADTGLSWVEIVERYTTITALLAENTTEIEENQRLLGVYEGLFSGIAGTLDAYADALSGFAEVSNVITSVSDALTTVADIQEAVAKGFTISLEKALEFAKVYPEILNGASVAADGQIALNKDVVNNFISGKEAELKAQIDAEVAKLEADKKVLTAKMEFSKAQLELAKSVGTGEGQISKEVAEYRVNAGNAVAQALIAAGIDEATAYQLACAAMAQNSEEFNRVAAEVCTDVQGNFNQAAYDAAKAIYTNMQNSKLSIASVAAQAHEAAKAIAGIASGTVQGSSSVQGGGAGGSYTGKGNITVHSGSFQGTEYTYEAKAISLEDFISDLELDISNYSKAISQIDGQIATLKALRNTSLEKFASSNKAKNKKKSGSKNKEASWFEKEYALHQHLLKMDAENVDDYLDWLNEAYQRAYKEGVIDLDDYYKYQEEVYTGLQDLFKDYLNDVEHEISMRQNYDGETKKIIQLYEGLIKNVEKEIAAARSRGLSDEDDYIQELQKKWQDYTGSITDLRDELTNDAKDALAELVDYRIDMLKHEVEAEKEALDKKLDNLKEFYDRQKELLQDQRDEEKYLDEQTEKRKTISDLQAELDMLGYDDSAWAQKRRIELQAELAEAQKDLDEFEKDHALDLALDALDKAYSDQESQLQAEMDALEEKLNDPEALYNKALEDIRKNSENQLYYQMLMYNRQFGDGNDETVIELWESAYGALTDYEKLFGALYKGVRLENETGVKSDGGWDSEVISGTNPNNKKPAQSTATSKPSTNESGSKAPALTKGSSIQVKRSATHFGSKSGGVRMASQVPGGTYTVYKTSDGQVLIGRNGVYTGWIKKSDIVGYRSGTNHSIGGLAQFDEEGDGSEYIFESSDGNRYRMFAEGSKVLNAKAADFLYNFATTGGNFLTKTLTDLLGLSGLGNMHRPVQSIEVYSGDIIVQGNASERTVSEIRRAQRDSLEFVLKELNKLNK